MGLIPVAAADVATVVTTLRMAARPSLRSVPESRLRLVRWDMPSPERYRTLFRRVGERWLWYSRLALADAALTAILADDRVAVHAVVDPAGTDVGMVELDHRTAGHCEIAYFGLVPELTGQGHGRWLMAETLMRAWIPGVKTVGVNTCTLDSPRALDFYRARGFAATGRTIESFPDPRALGLLPRDAAPQIPYLASRR